MGDVEGVDGVERNGVDAYEDGARGGLGGGDFLNGGGFGFGGEEEGAHGGLEGLRVDCLVGLEVGFGCAVVTN